VGESHDINAMADQILCACPAEPPCEVCVYAGKFAEHRRRRESDGTRFWTELNDAVQRDLGRLA
jgi:hypothetical protein